MPVRRKYNRRRAPRRRNNQLATRPRFVPRGLAMKRWNNLSTKVFYFNLNGVIETATTGVFFNTFNVQNIVATPPAQLQSVFALYDEYKMLSMRVKFFPANVGIESDTAILSSNGLLRGDVVVWSDQKGDVTTTAPNSIANVINYGSCRMINARRPYTRSIFRPKGHPQWGKCSNPAVVPDGWDGSINIYGQDTTTTANRKLWWFTISYKVLVRGRTQ